VRDALDDQRLVLRTGVLELLVQLIDHRDGVLVLLPRLARVVLQLVEESRDLGPLVGGRRRGILRSARGGRCEREEGEKDERTCVEHDRHLFDACRDRHLIGSSGVRHEAA
jgi:hypothetical protein